MYKNNLPYHRIIMLGAAQSGKTTTTDAMLLNCIVNKKYIDLGCDPGMTQEGRDMLEHINKLKRSLNNV